jgi:sporulation protein YlmC with PRC-barrel domain
MQHPTTRTSRAERSEGVAWALTVAVALVAALAATFGPTRPAHAQGEGPAPIEAGTIEATRVATGWSVKRSLLGKAIFNEAGQRVGKVDDLIVSPERRVSYIIVRAGGFIGMGRHDVAIPVSQIQETGGRLVMPGATRETIQAMPAFSYANDAARRGEFVARVDRDIARGRARIAELERQSGDVAVEGKARLEQQIAELQVDLQSAESRLSELKQAAGSRWREFEASVSAAAARLRRALEPAIG